MNMDKQTLKHALISIVIGCGVALITDVSHLLINYLQHLNSPIIGGGAGAVSYLAQKIKLYT